MRMALWRVGWPLAPMAGGAVSAVGSVAASADVAGALGLADTAEGPGVVDEVDIIAEMWTMVTSQISLTKRSVQRNGRWQAKRGGGVVSQQKRTSTYSEVLPCEHA